MSAFQFNISLGQEVEFYNRVNNNDPTNSAFIMVVLALAGLEADSVLKDYDTLSALLAGTSNEVTNTNYARKVITDADIAPYTVDDSLNQILLTLPSQVFSNIAPGDTWRKVLICYDSDTTGGTDANIIPVTAHDLLISGVPISPASNNITVDFSSAWLYAS